MKITCHADLKQFESANCDFLTERNTPYSIIRAAAERFADNTAIRYLTATDPQLRWRDISYREFLRSIHGAASVFRRLGVTADSSVALLAQHTPSAQLALWGAQLAGRAAPINPMLDAGHIVALLRANASRVVVMTGANPEISYCERLLPVIREALPDLVVLYCDAEGEQVGFDGHFEALVADAATDELPSQEEGDCDSIAACYHTGGTTAAPKLVMHSRLNEAVVAKSCALMHDYRETDIVLNGFPMFHVAGAFVYGLAVLSVGGALLIPGRMGMRNTPFMGDIWQHVEATGLTVLGAVPTLMSAMMSAPLHGDVSQVRAVLTGGSPLPTELADAFEARFSIPVRNIFGMTESAGSIGLESVHAPRVPKSCGFPLPFSEVKIIASVEDDPASTEGLSAGSDGIIAVKGANISPGYQDTAHNPGTFVNGWLITGDVGHLDSEQRLFITGRQKDVIIRGSHNIDPQTIEGALLAHDDIDQAAAVGLPDSYAGELPMAFVKTLSGVPVDEAALIDYLRNRLEDPASVPRRIVTLESLPVTPVGKVFKPSLRRQAVALAIGAAADQAGVGHGCYEMRITEALTADIEVNQAQLETLRDALRGMPFDMTLHARSEQA